MSDPFDISKALEGAVKDKLSPEVSRFKIHSEHSTAGDQEKAIEKLISQLENKQERCVLLGVPIAADSKSTRHDPTNQLKLYMCAGSAPCNTGRWGVSTVAHTYA